MKNPSSFPFKVTRWEQNVAAAGCTVHSISELQRIDKRDGTHLFSLLDVDVTDPEGKALPHAVFIRGYAVVIVPLLINRETGEQKFLMVRQRRIGNGQLSLEFPAGMLDGPDDNPADVAIRELCEETGLIVTHPQLFFLTSRPLHTSAGASDEAVYYFGCRLQLLQGDYARFNLKTGGNPEENEHITLALLTRAEAEPQITSLQARLGFYLFDGVSQGNTV